MQQYTRVFVTCGLSLVLASCGWFAEDAPPLEEGYVYLFDGDSLAGWRAIGGDATFTVEGNTIVGRHGPGDNSFLRTEQLYGDFILKLDFKWDELGNSGVLFRAQQRPPAHKGAGRAYGYQLELDHSERNWSGGIYDEARRGWLAQLDNNPKARAALDKDGWNELVIEANGGLIKTAVNGVPAATLVDAMDLTGFIALQVHAGKKGVMRWRNIRIKALGEHQWRSNGVASPADWKVSGGELVLSDGALQAVPAEGQTLRLTSRRQFADFALRFELPLCERPSLLTVRGGQSGGGASLRITASEASFGLAAAEPVANYEFDAPAASQTVLLSAVGNDISVNVGEQLVGKVGGDIADRGKLVLELDACGTQSVALNSLQWLDLKPKDQQPRLYQTLDTPPAPPLTPEEALAGFRLAPGFHVELVAAEPLVAAPVAMAWDEAGRLYVVEMRGFMPDAYGEGQEEAVGRVVVLEDTDNDGRMDTSDVYLDQLVNPRAIAVVNEGVLIGEPPNLWLCKGSSDGRQCGEKQRLGDYGLGEKSIEHLENGLMPGLDNWLYSATSKRRLRIAKGELVEQPTVFRGQWGLSQDNQGRIYHNHNSAFINGDFFPAEYVKELAGNGEAAGIGAPVSTDPGVKEEVFSIRVNPGVNRAYVDGVLKPDGRLASPTAVSGLAVNRGDQFPAAFAQDVFVPEPAANVVAHFRRQLDAIEVKGEHQTYPDEQWGQREFMASTDERFRPVDAKFGPDGALYIIDMYRGIIQEQSFLTDELREQIFERGLDSPLGLGRLWRVVHSDSPLRRKHTAPADTRQLVAALSHPNGWQRDTAQRLLIQSGQAQGALRTIAGDGRGLAAVHALWALEGSKALDSDTLKAALAGEPEVQLQALRAGFNVLDVEALLQFTAEASEGSVALRQQLVFNLGRFADQPAVQSMLLELLTAGRSNPYIIQAALSAVAGHEQAMLALLLADARWASASEAGASLVKGLALGAYLTQRTELAVEEAATPGLTRLLELTGAQSGDSVWQQVAMLEGFKAATRRTGFVPVRFSEAPAIFSDTSLSEDNPLWAARLAGRRAFTWPGDELAAGLVPLGPKQMALMQLGEALYSGCAACHGGNGQGTAGLAPALAGTEWVLGPQEWLTRIILQGLSGPIEIDGQLWNGVMPGHLGLPGFDDNGVAGLMTYLRRSWGNSAEPVAPESVAAVRVQTASRSTPWTVAELRQIPFDRGFDKYTGKYKVSFITFSVFIEDSELRMKVPMYGGGPMVQVAEHRFESTTGEENVLVEFEVAANGTVPAMIILRDDQKIRAERVE